MINALLALFVSAVFILLAGCTNAIPTVTQLESVRGFPKVQPKDSRNFAQLNGGSRKESLPGGYQGVVRISQPLAEMDGTSTSGYKIKGTVNLAR